MVPGCRTVISLSRYRPGDDGRPSRLIVDLIRIPFLGHATHDRSAGTQMSRMLCQCRKLHRCDTFWSVNLRADEITLVQRKRELVRAELAEAAMMVIAERGYDNTTIDQMAAAASVSRRTFFRYFESKEQVVVHSLDAAGAQLVAALAERPADESPAVALRRSFATFMASWYRDPERALRLAKVILGAPFLLGCYHERQAGWRREMAAELGRRWKLERAQDLGPELVAAVALAAFDVALGRWVAEGDAEGLDALIDEAFTILDAAISVPSVPGWIPVGAATSGSGLAPSPDPTN
jgi:AcrR family transcriptional regulator